MPRAHIISLRSSDGVVLKADAKITQLSSTIRQHLETSSGEEEGKSPIPVEVASSPLKSIIAWCDSKWDSETLKNMDHRLLLLVILSAKYLDIEPLFLICCQTVAGMFQYERSNKFVVKSPDQIRRTFGIVNDLTDEEKSLIELETAWICAGYCDHSHGCDCVDCRYGFPLLELPDDIISAIFKQMNIVARLLGRVNRRLFAIESHCRFDIKEVAVCDNYFRCSESLNERQIELKQHDIVGILQKLAQNHTVNKITVKARDTTTDHLSGLMPYIKAVPSRVLEMDISSYIRYYGSWRLDLNDDSVDEWIRDREFLNLSNVPTDLSELGLFRLFNDITSSKISLRRVVLKADHQVVKNLLQLIGITFVIDTWTSTIAHVKIYSSPNTKYFVIGPNMLITVVKDGNLSIERHNDDGPLPSNSSFESAHSIQSIISEFPILNLP